MEIFKSIIGEVEVCLRKNKGSSSVILEKKTFATFDENN